MKLNLVEEITQSQLRTDLPDFKPGYQVRVDVRIQEGDKFRIQAFEGLVIARQGKGIGETFIVRKMSSQIGVERTFPVNAPTIESIEVVKKGMVRRAKLNFLKGLKKEYKVKERN